MKRSASAELVGIPSPFHTGVTLFEPAGPSPRRSKRLKVEPDAEPEPELSLVAETNVKTRTTRKKNVKVEETETTSEVAVKPPRPSASPRKAKPVPSALAVPHPAPLRWKEQYDAIKQMRDRITAPVDTMGCDQAQLKETDPKVSDPHHLPFCTADSMSSES